MTNMTPEQFQTTLSHLADTERLRAETTKADLLRATEASAERFAEAAMDLAEQEAKAQWLLVYSRRFSSTKHSFNDLKMRMIEELVRGAEDTSSGRYNDIRRVIWDGKRAAYEAVRNLIEEFEG